MCLTRRLPECHTNGKAGWVPELRCGEARVGRGSGAGGGGARMGRGGPRIHAGLRCLAVARACVCVRTCPCVPARMGPPPRSPPRRTRAPPRPSHADPRRPPDALPPPSLGPPLPRAPGPARRHERTPTHPRTPARTIVRGTGGFGATDRQSLGPHPETLAGEVTRSPPPRDMLCQRAAAEHQWHRALRGRWCCGAYLGASRDT